MYILYITQTVLALWVSQLLLSPVKSSSQIPVPVGSQPGIPAGIPGPVKSSWPIPVPVGSQPGIPAGIPAPKA